MSFVAFLLEYKFVIAFYIIIFILIALNRKKFEVQAKVIFLLKTKIGLKFMDKFSKEVQNPTLKKIGRGMFKFGSFFTIITGVLLFVKNIVKMSTDYDLFTGTLGLSLFFLFSFSFLLFFISIVFFREFERAGRLGIWVGFAGMLFISFFIIKGFFDLFFKPDAPAVISPVIPGVAIPGSQLFIPFWYGIIALFIVVVIHEFSHGLLARTHKIKVKSTGVGMLTILPLAFVEPDEKELAKANFKAQNSMFAAGPFSNILTGLLFVLIVTFLLTPWTFSMVKPIENGVKIYSVEEGTPAYESGVGVEGALKVPLDVLHKLPISLKESSLQGTANEGVFINSFNGVLITNVSDFFLEYDKIEIGVPVILANDEKSYEIIPMNHTGNPYLGVNIVSMQIKEETSMINLKSSLVVLELFIWLFTLSFGLGLANLLPIGITDGGRMIQSSLMRKFEKKKAMAIFARITFLFLTMIIILLIVPIIKDVFF